MISGFYSTEISTISQVWFVTMRLLTKIENTFINHALLSSNFFIFIFLTKLQSCQYLQKHLYVTSILGGVVVSVLCGEVTIGKR